MYVCMYVCMYIYILISPTHTRETERGANEKIPFPNNIYPKDHMLGNYVRLIDSLANDLKDKDGVKLTRSRVEIFFFL